MKNTLQLKIFYITLIILSLYPNLDVKCDLDLTKNKEFVLTFPPNYHNNWSDFDTRLRKGDSIYIFIYAEIPTKGVITFKDVYDKDYTENFEITDPEKVYVFKRPSYDYALRGFNLSGSFPDNTHSEKIVDYSFKIVADNPIQVYGHSQATLTSESFNVLPIESLGNNYLVLAYNANVSKYSDMRSRTPSQFAIVAVEDNTNVEIKPSTATRFNGLKTQNIILNAGQVYLVQSNIESIGGDVDLSRSEITSDKPIAVFSGQQRTAVPYDAQGANVSRDYVVEQMPPIESWSSDAVVVPLPAPSRIDNPQFGTVNDKYRVIAAFDNTELFVDNALLTILNKGEFYEDDLVTPIHIKATAPIMAAAYKRSSGLNGDNQLLRGDPLLQIIPTPSQFGDAYRFITIQAYEYNQFTSRYDKVYDEHFITIISEPENIPSLNLDGSSISASIFKDIEGSTYKYAQIQVLEGTHVLKGDKPFGLFVCGYGYANSYGYFSGVIVKRDDYEPPELQSSVDCFEASGIVTDQKIKSISTVENSLVNVDVNIEKFTPYVQEAKFDAKLKNKYADGSFRIVAVDSIGQQKAKNIEIAGYTVTIKSELSNDEETKISKLEDSLLIGSTKCYNYKIINYGKYDHNIDISEFLKRNPNLTVNIDSNFDIKAGAEINFQICVFSNDNIDILDTLVFDGECTSRNVLAINIVIQKDENAPQVSSKGDPCNQYLELNIDEALQTDMGIKDIEVDVSENVNFDLVEKTNNKIRYVVRVKNPNLDAYFHLIVTDLAGNKAEYEYFFPGYTIDFSLIDRDVDSTMTFDFGKKTIGVRYCDSIRLTNYGANEIVFNNVRLNENIWFSVPPAQLPLVIPAGESISLKICYWSSNTSYDFMSDTLNFAYNCLTKQIVLLAEPDSLLISYDSKCDIPLEINVDEIPKGIFASVAYPNPSSDIVNLDINNPEKSNVNIYIYNQLGREEKNLQFNGLGNGYYTIPIDVQKLENGYYYYRIIIADTILNGKFIIMK